MFGSSLDELGVLSIFGIAIEVASNTQIRQKIGLGGQSFVLTP